MLSRPVPRVLVVDHHDSYTWNLVHLIASVTGTLPDVVEHDEATIAAIDGYTHVVLSPGPGHPAVVADFDLGRAVLLESPVPVLGVCLGMQGLVTAYGGSVERARPAHGEVAVIEHGGSGVLAGIPDRFKAVRYHSLAVSELPDVLRAVAWTADGERIVMAVEHRDRALWGVQFHPESVLTEHGARIVANFLAQS